MRRAWLTGVGLGVLAGVAVALRGAANSRRLMLERLTVAVKGLPAAFEGLRLLHLTDLHLRRASGVVDQLLMLVEDLDPDLVCLTGDYAYTALSLADAERLFRGLALRPAVAAVFGNTDYRDGITRETREHWAQLVPFLTNTATALERGGARLWLAGVDDPHLQRDDVGAALACVPADEPAILLAHSPEVIESPIPAQVRLILSGHTHGGQICLPSGRALYQNMRLPMAMASGLHAWGGATLYVSRGVGATRMPLRFGCLPEVTLFTLTGA